MSTRTNGKAIPRRRFRSNDTNLKMKTPALPGSFCLFVSAGLVVPSRALRLHHLSTQVVCNRPEPALDRLPPPRRGA